MKRSDAGGEALKNEKKTPLENINNDSYKEKYSR